MNEFFYEASPMRVHFGSGSRAKLADEVGELGLSKALILATDYQVPLAREISKILGPRSVGVWAGAKMHVPIESASAAGQAAVDAGADCCVVVGGGSTVGLGKAVALKYGTPIIALPTTYAGSEMTPVWGLTADGVKTTGRDRKVLPVSVIYDPELTVSLPVPLSIASAFNAIAHAVEALYAPDRSPVISLMAEDGVRSLLEALPRIVEDSTDITHRSAALYGSWLCGATLGATTMSLHHKLCHVLGGTFNLPHAETHTVVLPYVLAYNTPCAPEAVEALRRATSAANPAECLRELSQELGAPASLRELGLGSDDIDTAVAQATRSPYANPRPFGADDIRAILVDALDGAPVRG